MDKASQELEDYFKSLQEKIPPPKAFPYAKRWWSQELTNLRKEYNYLRNQWTTAKRRGDFNPLLRTAMIKANRVYLTQIARQKKNHWKEFLDDHQNVWKALAYLNHQSKTWTLPTLKVKERIYKERRRRQSKAATTDLLPTTTCTARRTRSR